MNDIVEGAWSLFRKSVVSPEAGPEQLSQTRDAFIAGAEMLFTLLTTLSDAPEAHQMSVMGQIDAELKRWKQAKLAGESAAGRRTT